MRPLPVIAFIVALLCSTGMARAATHAAQHGRGSSRDVQYLTPDSVNASAPLGNASNPALIVRTEVLLDRDGFSPGEIDAKEGDNYRKALAAFQATNNLKATGKIDDQTWTALASGNNAPPLTSYTIASTDVAGPFTKRPPPSLTQMAELPGVLYQNPQEELAERFHMNQGLLRRLNPHAQFDRAGEKIVVANMEPMALQNSRHAIEALPPTKDSHRRADVATIVVEKASRDVRAYDKGGKLVAFYPATIGSTEKPAPSGTFRVQRVAYNPDYHYDPKFAWKGVKAKKPLVVKPGPNNPVGLVWIDLTAPSYGIHGTPGPEKVGKTESHGCIRLTNWDALNLARMVHKGTVVRFEDKESTTASTSE
jgi:lipoprotein-anchoring transpeptidase ErfK/SrfK